MFQTESAEPHQISPLPSWVANVPPHYVRDDPLVAHDRAISATLGRWRIGPGNDSYDYYVFRLGSRRIAFTESCGSLVWQPLDSDADDDVAEINSLIRQALDVLRPNGVLQVAAGLSPAKLARRERRARIFTRALLAIGYLSICAVVWLAWVHAAVER